MNETNQLNVNGSEYHHRERRIVDWTDPQLQKVTRLRLLSDPGFPFWDVSYCYGVLRDGTEVEVRTSIYNLHKRKSISSQIVAFAIKAGVNAKKLGLLNSISTLN